LGREIFNVNVQKLKGNLINEIQNIILFNASIHLHPSHKAIFIKYYAVYEVK
jgi:hypothetical protein